MIGALSLALTIPTVDLSACTRNTHIYAGEQDHRVLGQNRVAYTSWWAHLGQSQDLVILSCDSGDGLSIRMQEFDMTENSPFDRRPEALKALMDMEASGFLLTLDQIDDRYTKRGFSTTKINMADACACAALEGSE
ncbi:MAG: hypothetical protein AAGJ34_05140 [Pseudomonadota bacterium]